MVRTSGLMAKMTLVMLSRHAARSRDYVEKSREYIGVGHAIVVIGCS